MVALLGGQMCKRCWANVVRALSLLLLSLSAGGCAHFVVNRPLAREDAVRGYRQRPTVPTATNNADELLLVLAFSGGGTRAAALAYGVLEHLAATQVTVDGKTSRLLDQVDLISGVSGGSFVAAYYGLFGDRIFADFEKRVLSRDIETALTLDMLAPISAARLASSTFERTDLAAELYGDEIFDNATFADLESRPGPLIELVATDLARGTLFGFTQEQFDWLCSDLSTFPVARAVAASSAVPVLFSPVALQNFASQCDRPPTFMKLVASDHNEDARAQHFVARTVPYHDALTRPYIHLVDGGVADNLGLEIVLDRLLRSPESWRARPSLSLAAAKRVVFIVVNAKVEPDASMGLDETTPTLRQSLEATVAILSNRFDVETLRHTRTTLAHWVEKEGKRRCAPAAALDENSRASSMSAKASSSAGRATSVSAGAACEPPLVTFIEVSFDALHDDEQREALTKVPTAFYLPPVTVDAIRQAAHTILDDSPEFQALVQQLSPSAVEPPAGAQPAP